MMMKMMMILVTRIQIVSSHLGIKFCTALRAASSVLKKDSLSVRNICETQVA